MASFGERNLIRVGEQISCDMQIASIIASCQSQLSLRIRRLAPSHNNRSDRVSVNESWNGGCRAARSWLSRKKVSSAGKSDSCCVDHVGREDVRFFKTDNLLAQVNQIGGERIERSCRHTAAVVVGICRHLGIFHSSRKRRFCLSESGRPMNRRIGFSETEALNPGRKSSARREHYCGETQTPTHAIGLFQTA